MISYFLGLIRLKIFFFFELIVMLMLFLHLNLRKVFKNRKTPFQMNETGFSINKPLVN